MSRVASAATGRVEAGVVGGVPSEAPRLGGVDIDDARAARRRAGVPLRTQVVARPRSICATAWVSR